MLTNSLNDDTYRHRAVRMTAVKRDLLKLAAIAKHNVDLASLSLQDTHTTVFHFSIILIVSAKVVYPRSIVREEDCWN